MGMNGNGVARFQQHAADANVFADGLEFAKGATQREAQAYGQLKVESAVSSLDWIELS